MNNPTKKEIQRLIESKLEKALIEEGLTDWLKKGVQAASSAWNTIKDKLSVAANRVQQILQQKTATGKAALFTGFATVQRDKGTRSPGWPKDAY